MSITTFAPPPLGMEREIYDYLFKLTKQLNLALTVMPEQIRQETVSAKTSGSKETGSAADNNLAELKSLIIKTANDAERQIEALETTLESKYVATSDYGSFQEDIQSRLTETAASIEQALSYYAELIALVDEASAEFDSYVIETEGYIRQGIIGYENAVPVIGIAIGQNIRVTGSTEVVNGQRYDVIDTSSNMSVWTPDKLAFYINGTEAGYFSNGALYTGDTIVTGKLFMANNKWEISHGSGLTIKWIGG